MFPNNMEFFVRDRLAERYAEAKKHRLGQELTRQGALRLKLRLSQVLYWLGGQMMGWREMVRYSDKISAADQPERSTL
jgi:hypothetical protein